MKPLNFTLQVVKQLMENLVISHFHMMGLHTMIVWSGMEIPGAQLILAGEFALVPAIKMKEQVS